MSSSNKAVYFEENKRLKKELVLYQTKNLLIAVAKYF
jgi:ribosomal protein S17E